VQFLLAQTVVTYKDIFIHLFHWNVQNSLPFSGASSIPLCYIPFPSSLFHQLVFHPTSRNLAIDFFVYLSALLFPNSYITFWGEFYFLPVCTCPNQRNLFNLIVSVIVGFIPLHEFLYWVIFSNFLFHCHILVLKFLYTFSFQKILLFAFYLYLLFLMHMLNFCLLLCPLVLISVF
jgi:hypothetical protein